MRIPHVRAVVPVMIALLLLPLSSCAQMETIDIEMTDGTKLRTDIHKPAGEGPWPVLLLRSTYGRGFAPKDFVDLGCAVVIQDVRGMGDSQGEKHVFFADGWREDQHDGRDTVDWLLAQPWCNGKVGTDGGSALGITQMLLAGATQRIVSQYIEVAPASPYHAGVYQGGVLCQNTVEGWLTAIQQPHLIEVWKSHPYYDDYWKHLDAAPRTSEITAPAFFVTGWYDMFQQESLRAFQLRENEGGPGARGENFLVIKWSPHGPDTTRDYAYNENRFSLKMSELRSNWMAARLLERPEALEAVPKVHYYVYGDDTNPEAPGNEWRTAESWPPFETREQRWFLHADGQLTDISPLENDASRSFSYDPANPFPTHGGNNLLLPSGPYDQRVHAGRADQLAFQGEALAEPLEVVGEVRVRLYVSSDAPDTDFTAMLLDICPDGRQLNVVDNIQRVKLRRDLATPEPLLTGSEEIVALEFSLWSTAWIFDAGHRIGLRISSSNAPRFEPNPNTGADHLGGETRVAQNEVHLDAQHPSMLLLPVR